MKKNLLLLLWIATMSCTARVSAQGPDSRLRQLLVSENNSEAVIRQEMQGFVPLNTASNYVKLQQTGSLNISNIAASGRSLTIMALQAGNGNRIDLDVRGEDSQLVLSQQGNFNSMVLSEIVSNGSAFRASQSDNFNSLEIDGAKSGALPSITIEQRGGMRLIIDSPSGYHVR